MRGGGGIARGGIMENWRKKKILLLLQFCYSNTVAEACLFNWYLIWQTLGVIFLWSLWIFCLPGLQDQDFLLLYLPKKTLLIYLKGKADTKYQTMYYEGYAKKVICLKQKVRL